MEWKKITEEIFLLPATETPLSAEVGVIRSGGCWIFDVGSTPEAAECIAALPEPRRVVLSHFHADHAGNLGRVQAETLYGGPFTCRKFGRGTPVTGPILFPDGVRLFPLPSGHAKGCVGLEYKNYAFLGDAVYPAQKEGRAAYNAGLLQEVIAALKELKAERCLLSHRGARTVSREGIIAGLEKIYARRDPHSTYIFPEE